MTKKIFGTDGVRGRANKFPMTSDVALALGRALADKVRTSDNKRNKIVLGKDTRISCYMIEMAFASGVCSRGVDVMILGPMPTPAVAHLTKDMRADAGVMITASHNLYEDNGIKIFGRDGFKLSDDEQRKLEEQVTSYLDDGGLGFTEDLIGKAYKVDDARGRYIAHLKSAFPPDLDLSGMRITIDCANGAAYVVAPKVLEELGADVEVIANKPNGTNINYRCGAMDTYELQHCISVSKEFGEPVDIGIALDGDADRLVVVDENGEVVHGDVLLALASWYVPEKEQAFVATVMSGMALKKYIERYNDGRESDLLTTDVGDRAVIEEMRRSRVSVGGEQSGHIIYLDHSTTGDGMVAALKLLATMRYEKKPLSELAKVITPNPQVILNVPVSDKKVPINEVDALKDTIDGAYKAMNGEGRVIVRYSGTEDKLRIMVEHKDKATADVMAEGIANVARRTL